MVTLTLGTCTYAIDRVVTLQPENKTRIIAHELNVDYGTQAWRADVMLTKTLTGWAFSSNNLGTHYEGAWATLIDAALIACNLELQTIAKN